MTGWRVRDALARLAAFNLAVAAVMVAGIVVFLTLSSVRRYVLGQPLAATEELAALMFMAMAFLALLPGLTAGRHVRLTLFAKRLSPRWRRRLSLLGDALTLGFLIVVIRESWKFAAFSAEIGARSEVAEILLWPWMFILPVAVALLALGVIGRALLGGDEADARGSD